MTRAGLLLVLVGLAGAGLPAAAGGLWLPVRGVRVSGFGWRDDPFGEGWRLHQGVDVAAPEGAPVAARAEGVVVRRVQVPLGSWVRAGGVIGEVGSTGRSTGPHLHFEVRYREVPVDPCRT